MLNNFGLEYIILIFVGRIWLHFPPTWKLNYCLLKEASVFCFRNIIITWPIGSISLTMEKHASKHLGNTLLQFFRNKRLPFGNRRRIRLLLMKHTPRNWKCIKCPWNILHEVAPWRTMEAPLRHIYSRVLPLVLAEMVEKISQI